MGTVIGISIIVLWLSHLIYLFSSSLSWTTPESYLHLAVQGYLTTGLFITAHDAMHGSVSRVRWLNHAIGYVEKNNRAKTKYRKRARRIKRDV